LGFFHFSSNSSFAVSRNSLTAAAWNVQNNDVINETYFDIDFLSPSRKDQATEHTKISQLAHDVFMNNLAALISLMMCIACRRKRSGNNTFVSGRQVNIRGIITIGRGIARTGWKLVEEVLSPLERPPHTWHKRYAFFPNSLKVESTSRIQVFSHDKVWNAEGRETGPCQVCFVTLEAAAAAEAAGSGSLRSGASDQKVCCDSEDKTLTTTTASASPSSRTRVKFQQLHESHRSRRRRQSTLERRNGDKKAANERTKERGVRKSSRKWDEAVDDDDRTIFRKPIVKAEKGAVGHESCHSMKGKAGVCSSSSIKGWGSIARAAAVAHYHIQTHTLFLHIVLYTNNNER
jgi:hypothetical protein